MLALPLALTLVCAQAPAGPRPTAEEAKAFTRKADAELMKLWVRSQTAEWIKSTYITDDTERNAAALNEDVMAFLMPTIKESLKYQGLKTDPDTERMLTLLRYALVLPAPADPAKRSELAGLAAKLEGLYGKGKYCPGGKDCRDLEQLSAVLAKVGEKDAPSAAALLDAWAGWREPSREMRPLYERLVALSNEGARDLGAKDLGELWRGAYDMSPEAFEKETDRLWAQMRPLYEDLHCYVRRRLSEKYGAAVVARTGPLPAHLLGNMWAQDWSHVYPLVEPYAGEPSLDVTKKLVERGYTPQSLVKLGESFFTGLGFPPLPATFWERSQFTKPADRDVVCHASAWDVTYANDLRIKMCIKIDEEDLETVHHELGHDFYFQSYYTKPALFQQGANDGFHEAVGDAITLSITPEYLKRLGLLDELPKNEKGLINVQMKAALAKIAFVPFGRMIDQWRWDVFSGKTPPAQYNAHWWELAKRYQGIAPASARGEDFFDPGAKYHIAANVPYMRYFIALVLQYQFHRALCQAAGHKGPLHTCSIANNAAAGQKLKAMLALGSSRPWPEALEVVTGQRQMDASAVLEYYAPLRKWLKEQNKGEKCGW